MVKAVIFDIGRVILPIDWSRVVEKLGLSKEEGERLGHLVSTGAHYDRYERGDLTTEQFFNGFKAEYGLEHDHLHLKQAWTALLLPPFPGLSEVMEDLKQKTEVYALSNTNEAHFEHFTEEFEIFTHFDEIFSSHHLRARKPEPEIYHSALRAIGRTPQEVLFLDDLKSNVEAARIIGMRSERVENSVEQIIQALKNHGVLK